MAIRITRNLMQPHCQRHQALLGFASFRLKLALPLLFLTPHANYTVYNTVAMLAIMLASGRYLSQSSS